RFAEYPGEVLQEREEVRILLNEYGVKVSEPIRHPLHAVKKRRPEFTDVPVHLRRNGRLQIERDRGAAPPFFDGLRGINVELADAKPGEEDDSLPRVEQVPLFHD